MLKMRTVRLGLEFRRRPQHALLLIAERLAPGGDADSILARWRQAGVVALLAADYAPLFYRSAWNGGLLALRSDAASLLMGSGEEIEVDPAQAVLANRTYRYQMSLESVPYELLAIWQAGGFGPYAARRFFKEDQP